MTSGEMADQDGSDASPPASQASFYKSDDERAFSPAAPGSSVCSPTLTSTATPTSGGRSPNNDHAAPPKSDSSLFNKTDERLRLARERREEYDKQNAAKEAEWQAREERARRHYQNHLEERRRKLEEQRLKEERRRSAVEEKRRRKMADDQVRHEAVMRRTMERGPAPRAKANRWSWGGPLPINSPASPATATDGDRRSASTVNLSKQHEPVITKRLSSSSATLLHSPDRGRRRLPLTPWESNVVQRLQQPTHSYLARSRSAACLSGEQRASFQSPPGRPLSHSRSHDRSLGGETSASARRRTVGTAQTPQKNRDSVRKSWGNLSLPLGPALTLPLKIRTSSPIKRDAKMMAPSPGRPRPPQKTEGRPPTPRTPKGLGAEDPGNLRPVKSREAGDEGVPAPDGAAGDGASPKPCAGITDPEEASRILAEKRRLVRRQREREEEERDRQEQKARLAQEEMARRKAEERAKREEEARLKEEEDRLKEEAAERRAEEERLQREREEAEEAQKALKQREEEESRQKEETERLKQEREKHFQKEEAERLERKKRLEEIMKRTRRSDPTDKKTSPDKMAEPAEGAPGPRSNGCPAAPDPNADSPPGGPPAPRENGQLEDGAAPCSAPEENGLPEADVA